MKSFQNRLLHDFDVKQEMMPDGKGMRNVYVYKGEYAVWQIDQDLLRRYRKIYAGLILINIVLFFLCSFQRVDMNTSHLVGFFTLLSLVLLIAETIGVVEFEIAKRQMYLRDCKIIKDVILWSAMIHFLVLAAATVSGVVYLAQAGFDITSGFVILGFLISAFTSFLLWILQNRLKYSKVEKNTFR